MEHMKVVVKGKLLDPLMDIVNVFYGAGPTTYVPGESAASGFVNYIYEPITAELPSSFQINGIYVSHWTGPSDGIWWDSVNNKPLKNPPWSVETPVTFSAFVGTGTGDMLPPAVAALIYCKTGTKHVIARKFFGPVMESAQDKGILNATPLTHFQLVGTRWLGGLQFTGETTLASEVWGYKHGFNSFLGVHTDEVLATQRRRKPGRGS